MPRLGFNAPKLTMSQKVVTLLGKSKTRGKAVLPMPFEGTRDRRHSPHDTHARGVGDWPLRLPQQRRPWPCLLSTPAGKIGWFYEAWQNGDEWQRVRITAEQCPRISPEFLAEEQRDLPFWFYRQGYFCEFTDTLLQVFRTDDVYASISPDVLPFDYDQYRGA
jgi:hypothetical protein